MDLCDVLIVGGGPAGSSCAWKLRQFGCDVMVLDKSDFPRHKVCAGWITPAVVSELLIDLQDYGRELVLQPITRFLTGIIGGAEVETDYQRTVSYGIRRYEFDNYLLRRADARMRLGEPFRSLRRVGDSWVVNEAIQARIVIGAGGHFCPVARHFRPTQKSSPKSEPDLPVVMAQEVEFEMDAAQVKDCSIRPERPELFFCPDLKGYGWIFRKQNWLNIGLGREGEDHLSAQVNEFVAWLQSRQKIPAVLPGPFRGHAYHLRTALPSGKLPDGVLLIGDAVGLADRQSGEGIRPAIESGLLAAATVLHSSQSGTPPLADEFMHKLQERFAASTKGSALANCIPSSMTRNAAHWLMRSKWFSRNVLLDRWFLHTEMPLLKV